MRGTEDAQHRIAIRIRITPACAGNRSRSGLKGFAWKDHPRVCGEQLTCIEESIKEDGSPPRVRGTVGRAIYAGAAIGITPACAGNREISAFMDIEL